jgi:hypothetical protein
MKCILSLAKWIVTTAVHCKADGNQRRNRNFPFPLLENTIRGKYSLVPVGNTMHIPIYIVKSAGKLHFMYRNTSENSYIHIRKCWKIPLCVLENVGKWKILLKVKCAGNVYCLCMKTQAGKSCQPWCLVLQHPLYMSEVCINPFQCS